MITLSSAENVLKDVYLGVIANQISTKTNPLFNMIKKSSRNIVGKEIRFAAPVGINGGIMAGSETCELPEGMSRPFLSLTATLKNLYGRLEISDKAIKCSSSDVNSFVNLLQDGMDSLIQASVFNLSRMLYGNGSGEVAKISEIDGEKAVVNASGGVAPGMHVDIYKGETLKAADVVVASVNNAERTVLFNKTLTEMGVEAGDKLYVHNSRGNEITGLKGILANETIYGVTRAENPVLTAHKHLSFDTDAFDEAFVQTMIDAVERNGTTTNYISTSYELKRTYQQYLTLYKKNVEFATLENGSKYVAHVGVPIVPTSFVNQTEAYFLNTDDFTFYELGDWKWLEDEAGRVLKQHSNKPTYSATLVKYTELVCQKINGVGYCSGMKTTVSE